MPTDPMIAMMERIAQGGWASLDAAHSDIDQAAKRLGGEQKIEQDRQAAIVAKVLATEDGRALLNLLLEKSLLAPQSDAERAAQTAEAYAIAKAKREGRDSIVLMLIGMLQYAAGQKDVVETPGG